MAHCNACATLPADAIVVRLHRLGYLSGWTRERCGSKAPFLVTRESDGQVIGEMSLLEMVAFIESLEAKT